MKTLSLERRKIEFHRHNFHYLTIFRRGSVIVNFLDLFKTKQTERRTDFEGFVQVGLAVDVDVADALGVTEHGDVAALLLDGAHQIAGTARDHQIDVLVHGQQVADLVSRRYLRHKPEITIGYVDSFQFLVQNQNTLPKKQG